MIKIKAIILPDKDSDKEYKIDGRIDEESRLLFIKGNSKSLDCFLKLVMWDNSKQLVLIGIKNERIVLYNIHYLSEYKDCCIFNRSFDPMFGYIVAKF